ncbi:MAG TPA: D-2-hydroxyacid dehydrogenase [Symbiobacteriaceae bacterium]|jgi:phosphoglycerate dehydrogenase-like enzyme
MKIVVWAENAPRLAEKLAALPLPTGAELVAAVSEADALSHAPTADVLVAWGGSYAAPFASAAPRLRLVQSLGSGVEGILTPAFIGSPVPLANARGCNAPNMAEHTLALILALSRSLHAAVRNQQQQLWDMKSTRGGEIAGLTLGILGFGAIGQETARRARALGMRIAAVSRPGKPKPPEVDELVAGVGELAAVSDYFDVVVPLTRETTGLVGATELARMKPTAYLINVARGAVVDEPALIQALQEGRIAGAGLDVTVQEPLPAESPLWSLPNVLLTPHVAGGSPRVMDRVLDLVAENLVRLADGQPLLNLVDKRRGY